ncbi:MAG: DNA methylase [Verrucomicrobia bacterium]|nr:DNA methylase [Verrucomicrobiota bacterium]
MFPAEFVREKVERYSQPGDWVFDPFCGRGTTVLESLLLGRNAAGSDINPVAFCVARAKAERPTLLGVLQRIAELESVFRQSKVETWERERACLPSFFGRAFHSATLRELLFLRSALDWRGRRTDRFIAALILGSLHGEMDRSHSYFSNQMPRTICLKPSYSLRYWRSKGLFPQKRKIFAMLPIKAAHRLSGTEGCATGNVKLADSKTVARHFPSLVERVSLVVTSPPYLNVTRYEEDQWLRLWFLGGDPQPTYGKVSKDDRHNSTGKYWQFLTDSWKGLAPLLKRSATLVVRLGAISLEEKEMTDQLTATIKTIFPRSRMLTRPERSAIVRRQARNFLPSSRGCRYEMDFVFSL